MSEWDDDCGYIRIYTYILRYKYDEAMFLGRSMAWHGMAGHGRA